MTEATVNDPCECRQTTIRGCADMPSRRCGATEQTAPPVTDINALIAEMRAGLEGVTPGPWRVDEQKYPYGDGTASHKEHRIVTTWTHPQAKDCVDVTRLGVGIGLEGRPPIPMVRIEPPDAAHIARCSPANIRTLLDEIERLLVTLRLAEPLIDEGWRALPGEFTTIKGMADEIKRLRADNARLREAVDESYSTLAAAFNRIHGLPRTSDTELADRIGATRAKIERARKAMEASK